MKNNFLKDFICLVFFGQLYNKDFKYIKDYKIDGGARYRQSARYDINVIRPNRGLEIEYFDVDIDKDPFNDTIKGKDGNYINTLNNLFNEGVKSFKKLVSPPDDM